MIKGDVNKLIEWLNLNNIQHWSLALTSATQGNNKVFESNIECPRDAEIERMRQILSLSENSLLYVNGRQNTAKNVGNYNETWQNVSAKQSGESVAGVPKMDAVGAAALGYISPDECDRRIAAAIEKANYERAKEDLERERKEFREEKREFDKVKDGAIGMLIQKAMPYVGSLFNKQPMHAVAGISGTVEADKIEARSPESEEPFEPSEQPESVPESTAEPEIFTDEESDKLFSLTEKWKNSDPQYLQVYEKIVSIATSGEPIMVMGTVKMTYDQLKEMILKM